MTSAAESIVLTIVEGCGSISQREFARYLDMSLKSSNELEEELLLAKDNGALQEIHWRSLRDELVESRRMTCGLRARVLEAAEREQRKR